MIKWRCSAPYGCNTYYNILLYLSHHLGNHYVQYHGNAAIIAHVNLKHVGEDDEMARKKSGKKRVKASDTDQH